MANAYIRTPEKTKEHEEHTLVLHDHVQTLLANGEHIIYVDECCFVARSFQQQAWSNQKETILVEDRTNSGYQVCQAVCAALCKCHGVLTYMIKEKSFKKESFCEFLDLVGAALKGKKAYMFIDNCRMHHANIVADKMKEHKIYPVWNVPYKFEYNDACEKYWAQLKAHFRPLLLQKMLLNLSGQDKPLKDAVVETIETVSRASIPKFIDRGLRQLEIDAK